MQKRGNAPEGYRPQPMTVKASRPGPARPRPETPPAGDLPGGARACEPDKTPVRTMPAVRRATLAPWVLRVGTATSRRTSRRTRGHPAGRRQTGREERAGRGPPAQLIPVFTSMPPATGTRPTAPPRHHPSEPTGPGRPAPQAARDHRPAVQEHRRAGPRRAAPRGQEACRPAVGRRPGEAPDRPQPGGPATGPPRARHPVAGRPEAAPGPLRPCHRVAGHRGAPRDPARPCHRVIAPGPPGPCHRGMGRRGTAPRRG
jgi:hypothetical protein